MPAIEKELYRSSNGDRWFLIREPGSNDMFVRHQPNLASGGRSSVITVDGFLAEGHGPQHDALLRLIADAAAAGNADDLLHSN
jgi:hypothetical protein